MMEATHETETADIDPVDADDKIPQHHDAAEEGAYQPAHINVSRKERLGSVLGGSLLTLVGIRRRSNFGAMLMLLGGGLVHRGMTGYCRVNELLGRNSAQDGEAPEASEYHEHGVHVEQAVTISKSPEELYTFWRNFENLPRFMDHLKSVSVTDEKKSHWVAKAPAGFSVEWDAEIINDISNGLIAWRSLGGADVNNAGSVRFAPAEDGKGTEVRVVLDYIPPAGQVGQWIAKLFGEEPEQQVREDLHQFKQLMEGGTEKVSTDQSNGHA